MEKYAVIKCPSCDSQNIKKFSDIPDREFKCNKCGLEFGKDNVKIEPIGK